MIGIYLNEFESDLMIPLLVNKINNIYCFPALTDEDKQKQVLDLSIYQEVLARIYSAKNIGNLKVE